MLKGLKYIGLEIIKIHQHVLACIFFRVQWHTEKRAIIVTLSSFARVTARYEMDINFPLILFTILIIV